MIQEADKKVIELHGDDNSEAIMAMLKHLYGLNYETQDIGDASDDIDIAGLHVSVFMLGDKYDISSLRDEALERFRKYLEEERESDCLYNNTIFAIQKLLGPNAPQPADQSLIESATDFLLGNLFLFFTESLFRDLLAGGVMLKKDLAVTFLEDLNDNI